MRFTNATIGWLIALLLVPVVGCEREGPDEQSEQVEPTDQPDEQHELGPDQIVAILQTANRGEIEAAAYVRQHATQQAVKDAAEKIQQDHAAALAEENGLAETLGIAPDGNAPVVQQLERNQRRLMQQLRAQSGAEAGRTYVRKEIQVHEQTLTDIDQRFLPEATGKLAQHLHGVRAKVADHLSRLKAVERPWTATARAEPSP